MSVGGGVGRGLRRGQQPPQAAAVGVQVGVSRARGQSLQQDGGCDSASGLYGPQGCVVLGG